MNYVKSTGAEGVVFVLIMCKYVPQFFHQLACRFLLLFARRICSSNLFWIFQLSMLSRADVYLSSSYYSGFMNIMPVSFQSNSLDTNTHGRLVRGIAIFGSLPQCLRNYHVCFITMQFVTDPAPEGAPTIPNPERWLREKMDAGGDKPTFIPE